MLLCYAPRRVFGESEKCQTFTALGVVSDDPGYQVETREDFEPYRVDVSFADARCVDVRPLLTDLRFVEDESSGGFSFRRGLFDIPAADFEPVWQRMVGDGGMDGEGA